MPRKILGTRYTERSRRILRSPGGSVQYVVTYEGTEEAILGLIQTLSTDQAFEFDNSEAPKFRLTVSTPDSNDPVVTNEPNYSYELLGNSIQLDLLEHPALAFYDATDAGKRIRRAIEKGATGSDEDFTTAKTNISAIAAAASLSDTLALEFLSLYAKGTRHYAISQYVLRFMNTISKRTAIRIAFSNVETIYSNAQLIREAGVPGPIAFGIGEVTKVESSAGTGYTLGWLKQTPTLNQVYGGRYQITVEYTLYQWSTTLYSLSSAPT